MNNDGTRWFRRPMESLHRSVMHDVGDRTYRQQTSRMPQAPMPQASLNDCSTAIWLFVVK
eukprot:scaffold87717_cov21-Prasinocladus_malaysianus.AAC.2